MVSITPEIFAYTSHVEKYFGILYGERIVHRRHCFDFLETADKTQSQRRIELHEKRARHCKTAGLAIHFCSWGAFILQHLACWRYVVRRACRKYPVRDVPALLLCYINYIVLHCRLILLVVLTLPMAEARGFLVRQTLRFNHSQIDLHVFPKRRFPCVPRYMYI